MANLGMSIAHSVITTFETSESVMELKMQEDILETSNAVSPVQYIQCSRCGKVVPKKVSYQLSSSIDPDGISDYEYVCAGCYKLDIIGDTSRDDLYGV